MFLLTLLHISGLIELAVKDVKEGFAKTQGKHFSLAGLRRYFSKLSVLTMLKILYN